MMDRCKAFVLIVVMVIFPPMSYASIITVYDAGGGAHQVNTTKQCTKKTTTCVTSTNGRCVKYHSMYDCAIPMKPVCKKWNNTVTCANVNTPPPGNGIDFTNQFANALGGVAAGATVNKIFKAKPDSCQKDLFCNECKGQPDPGLQKIMGAAAMASSIAGLTIAIMNGAAAIALSTAAMAGSTAAAISSAAGGIASGIASTLGASLGAISTLAAAAPYIAIAMVVVMYLVASTCHPSKLNGYGKWLGKSAKNLGTQCTSKFLGMCVQRTTWFCVFDNKFSFILAREIKKQLGRPWPAPPVVTAAGCNNIYITDLSRVDFSKMNLQDLFGNLQAQAQKTNFSPSAVGQKIKSFYGSGVTPPNVVSKPSPPSVAKTNAKAAKYNPAIHASMTANGWTGGTKPPTQAPAISGVGAMCADTPPHQVAYIKMNFFKAKPVSQIRQDVIAQFSKMVPKPPACNKATVPPQTMQNTFCYDKASVQNATINELAKMFALALCDMKPLP